MVSTRSMASKGPDASDDATQLTLKKKPVRRATAKASATQSTTQKPTSTRSTPQTSTTTPTAATRAPATTRRAQSGAQEPDKAAPLSPKKITQVAKARPARADKEEKTRDIPSKSALAPPPPKPIAARTRRAEVVPAREPEHTPQGKDGKPQTTAGAASVAARPRRPGRQAATKPVVVKTAVSGVTSTPTAEAAAPVARRTRAKTVEPEAEEVLKAKAGGELVAVDEASVVDTETQEQQEVGLEDEENASESVPTPATETETLQVANGETKIICEESHSPLSESTQSPNTKAAPHLDQDSQDNDSADEICGPKTPMRRGDSLIKTRPHVSTVPRRLQTPSSSRAPVPTPRTQHLPLRVSATESAQRPMTEARARSKAMAFRPLESLDHTTVAEDSPSKNTHQPDQFEHGTVEHVAAKRQDDGSCFETNEAGAEDQPTPLDDHSSEDELQTDNSDAENEESDEEDKSLLDDPVEHPNEIDYELSSESSDDETNESDIESEEDETIVEPQLPDVALLSSPAPEAPELSTRADLDTDMLDMSSSAPSTPSSVIVRHTEHNYEESDEDEDDDYHHQDVSVPVSRLALMDDSTLSSIDDTPDVKSRMSLNTATTKMLQTPHMRAFKTSDEFQVDSTPRSHVRPDFYEDSQGIVCIDPALLSQDDEMFDLAREADEMAIDAPAEHAFEPASPSPPSDAPCQSSGSVSRFSLGGGSNARMSLLTDDILIEPADYTVAISSPTKAPMLDQARPRETEEAFFGEPELSAQHSEHAPSPVDVVSTATDGSWEPQADSSPPTCGLVHDPEGAEEAVDDSVEPLTSLPHYAYSTFSFDVRRKSMPSSFPPTTPQSAMRRPRTADTTTKPTSTADFSSLWPVKGRRQSSRRSTLAAQSITKTTPKPIEVVTLPVAQPTPVSTRKSPETPVTLRRSQRTPRATTFMINEQAATPVLPSARPNRHAPKSATSTHTTKTPLKPAAGASYSTTRTPIKTPLKAPGATPGSIPMTPHPAAPLRSTLVLVEVFTLDGSSASGPFVQLLHRLGARTTKTWSERVTHVVFKDGSPATLQKVRLSNKDARTPGAPAKKDVFCVNSRWVTDCDKTGKRMPEQSPEYAVDLEADMTKGTAQRHRRRKSMEPGRLSILDGNVVASGPAQHARTNTPDVASPASPPDLLTAKKPDFSFVARDRAAPRASLASTVWAESPVKGLADYCDALATPSSSSFRAFLDGAADSPAPTPFARRTGGGNGGIGGNSRGGPAEPLREWDAENEDPTFATPDLAVMHGYMDRRQELEMLQRAAPVNRFRARRLVIGGGGGEVKEAEK